MKKILILTSILLLACLSACQKDFGPQTVYYDNEIVSSSDDDNKYTTREDMVGLHDAMYSSWVPNLPEIGLNDWLIVTDSRSDNAYCGTTTIEIMDIESNNISAENSIIGRDWTWYNNQVTNANYIIEYIDKVRELDPTLSEQECNQWKAEAMCWRAWCWQRMTYLFKDVPLVTTFPPSITAANLDEVYSQYFPERTPIEEVYAKIIEDMTFAIQYAPDRQSDKMIFTKAFAHGILARLYAEKTCRDWSKVAEHCEAIEGMGYKLCENYGEMWSYDDNDAVRNTTESIFEVRYSRASGTWDYMMFHRNAYSPMDSYSWAKWTTPSRSIIQAYDQEGDVVRKNASIIYDSCTWSNYYPMDNYAFMHKLPTSASSIIVMRLAEIYLLHAEACCGLGDNAKATEYVNIIRKRAKLPEIAVPASKDAMIDAILKERRLELAFEGFRFYDLVRYDKAAEIHESMNAQDPYWQKRSPLTEETIYCPVPQSELDNNPNIQQNPGY